MHIFGIDYIYSLNEYRIWAVAGTFAFLWAAIFTMNLISLTLEAYTNNVD